jgi:oligoendopeptidase F
MPITKSKKKSYTWDLSPLYKSDADPQIEKDLAKHKKASYKFINKWKDRTDYLKSTIILKEALTDYEAWLDQGGILGDIGYYFSLRSTQEEDNPKLKARANQLNDFATKIENDSQFFALRLAKIPPAQQKKFLEDKSLVRWRHFLSRLFADAKYLLSEPEEKILNLKSSPAHGQWIQMMSTLLAKETRKVLDRDGRHKELPLETIISLLSHRQAKIRHRAAAALNDILAKFADVAEAEINALLSDKKINDELRGFSRPDAGRHLADDIDTVVVDSLISEVEKAFGTSQRFYKLKAKLMGKKTLLYHERNVPYGDNKKKFEYKDGVKLVSRVFKALDPDFYRYFHGFVEKDLIDVYPKKGKGGGAFCTYNLPTSPVYIMLNYTDELNDVRTLAHEAGHGINNELMREIQPTLYFGTPMVTAEVASTFAEDFVLAELLHEADDHLRLSLQMAKLGDEISTIMRQVAAYRFEQELHSEFRRQGYLSKHEIGRLFQKNMKAYMGPAIEQSPGSANWWIYWSHFRNFFYVYSYASGLLISKSLQAGVKKDPTTMTKVKDFLRAGTSDSPANIFKKLDIDIANPKFWRAGLKEIENLLDDTERLARRLGKI